MRRNKLFSIVLVIFLVIGVFLMSCSNAPSGKLSIKQTGSNTIDVSYSFSNVEDPGLGIVGGLGTSLFPKSFGSGILRFEELNSNTEYTFNLKDGDRIIATVKGITLKD